MSRDRWERNQDKVVTKPNHLYEEEKYELKVTTKEGRVWFMEGEVIPVTDNFKCSFLNEDMSCNIYDDRPPICQEFGKEDDIQLTCAFQDKEGRTRSRQESRLIVRKQVSAMERFKIL